MKLLSQSEHQKAQQRELRNLAKARQKNLTFGENLRHVRKACGLRLVDVSKQTGLDMATLSVYETDERVPPQDVIDRLAKLYGTTSKALCVKPPMLKLPKGLKQLVDDKTISESVAADLLKVAKTIRGKRPETSAEWKAFLRELRV